LTITLYQYLGGDGVGSISPPCLRADLALRWLGVDFERRDLRRGAEVTKVSRTGRLPVLDIDGERFVESTRILDELERRFDAPWVVESEQDAAHLRLWEYTINEYYYWCGYYLRWVDAPGRALFLNALLGRAPWFTRFMVEKMFVPKQVRRGKLHGVGGRDRKDVLAEVERGLQLLATELRGGPFLLGRDRPSRADLTVTSLFSQAGFRDAMPEVLRLVEDAAVVIPLMQRVYDTVGGEKPRWLA
jgi:glutathione S-transferase